MVPGFKFTASSSFLAVNVGKLRNGARSFQALCMSSYLGLNDGSSVPFASPVPLHFSVFFFVPLSFPYSYPNAYINYVSLRVSLQYHSSVTSYLFHLRLTSDAPKLDRLHPCRSRSTFLRSPGRRDFAHLLPVNTSLVLQFFCNDWRY
jgi:hypothetical protein